MTDDPRSHLPARADILIGQVAICIVLIGAILLALAVFGE